MRWAAHHFSSISRRKYSLLKVVGLKLQGPSKPDLSLWHLHDRLQASPQMLTRLLQLPDLHLCACCPENMGADLCTKDVTMICCSAMSIKEGSLLHAKACFGS